VRCLVTGATGQLGTALVRALVAKGHSVTALVVVDDPWAALAFAGLQVRQVTGNILARGSLPPEQFDWVFHLAANQSLRRGDRQRQWAINVDGLTNVLDWVIQHPPQRFIHVSSLVAVGLADRPELMDETSQFDASSLGLTYAASKQAGERLVLNAASKGIPAVIANPGTVIGPWDRGAHVWRMLRWQGYGLVRVVPSGGNNVVDARDVARGLMAVADHGRSGDRYLLTGHNLTYRQLAKQVAVLAGVGGKVIAPPGWLLAVLAHLGEMPAAFTCGWAPISRQEVILGSRYLYFDASKAQREFGFSARPLTASLHDSIEWYRESGLA
jgi:dihydroflavonol-4-reductase